MNVKTKYIHNIIDITRNTYALMAPRPLVIISLAVALYLFRGHIDETTIPDFRGAYPRLIVYHLAAANDHKILGVVAMPRNETNDLTLKLPVCRVVKRIQLSAERGDVQLSGGDGLL